MSTNAPRRPSVHINDIPFPPPPPPPPVNAFGQSLRRSSTTGEYEVSELDDVQLQARAILRETAEQREMRDRELRDLEQQITAEQTRRERMMILPPGGGTQGGNPFLMMPQPQVVRLDLNNPPRESSKPELKLITAEMFYELEAKVIKLEELVQQLLKDRQGINVTELV